MPKKTVTPKPISLNPEQQAVVGARDGIFKVVAGPGSGKSECLVQRYVRLVESGVNPQDILSLTFTNAAATSMRKRAESLCPVQKTDRTSGWMTFHGLALAFCTQEREHFPFKLAEFPLATEPVANKLVGEVGRKFEIDPRTLRPWISLQKRNRVRPAAALRQAEKEGTGEKLALAYKAYDAKLREMGVLDFDGLLFEMVELLSVPYSQSKANIDRLDLRNRWFYKFCQIDESQDCDLIQYDLARLISEKHKNIMFVGDAGQCQPPGTKVTTKVTCVRHAKVFPRTAEVNIENLIDGDGVITWSKRRNRVYVVPRPITVGSRHYSGKMLTISIGGESTRMTPDHTIWVKYTPHNQEKYIVYLMYRDGFGFRVGKTRMRTVASGIGLNVRAFNQVADYAWILTVCESNTDALHWENYISLRFNLPQIMFPKWDENLSPEGISRLKQLFDCCDNWGNGHKCLDYFNRLFSRPLFARQLEQKEAFSAKGYFKTAAANLLPDVMSMPLPGEQSSAPVSGVQIDDYVGMVYSMNVDSEHTYIADGVVVANCLYSFRGATSDLFIDMKRQFPEIETLYLAKNHRSSPQVVDLCKQCAPYPELGDRFYTENADGPEPEIVAYPSPADEAQGVISRLGTVDKQNTVAILGRTNRSLRSFEDALSVAGIKYHLLGRSGFWQQPEVKSVLSYLQCAVFCSDVAVMGSLRSPYHPSAYIKKKEVADKVKQKPEGQTAIQFMSRMPEDRVRSFVHFLDTLRRYRDVQPDIAVKSVLRDLKCLEYYAEYDDADNSPVENLKELSVIAAKFSSVKDFLDYSRCVTNASKSKSGVCLSTIHSAKGTEYNKVFVVAVQDGILPHAKAESVEDEKNCFFVAISRAKTHLHISYSGIPSIFLKPFLKPAEAELEDVFA